MRWSSVAGTVAGALLLGGLQLLILTTPTSFVSEPGQRPAGTGYKLQLLGRGEADLDVYGDAARPRVSLIYITEAATADPVQRPTFVLGRRTRHGYQLRSQVPPGTWKLVIPGARPFGLLSNR